MSEQEIKYIFAEMLSAALNETELDNRLKARISSDILPSLFAVAKSHDLLSTISELLYRNGILKEGGEFYDEFVRSEMAELYRQENIKAAYKEICYVFDTAGIDYIPLKGMVIGRFYPQSVLRTSCDIDILIKEEELERAITCLENKGYECGERDYHDVSLCSPSGMHLELHFSLRENIETLDSVLSDAWKYAYPTQGSRHELSSEFFVFHILAHTAYHFLSGGCGVRALVDIWVMRYKMKMSYSCASELLLRSGIYKFAVEITRLCDDLFSGEELDELEARLLGYIFEGGVYGSLEGRAAVSRAKTKSGAEYVVKRAFLPYGAMSEIYPRLKKQPVLLPFYWCIRIGKKLFSGRTANAVRELRAVKELSGEKAEEMRELVESLGL